MIGLAKGWLAALAGIALFFAGPASAKPARPDAIPAAVATYLDAQGKEGFSGTVLVARHGAVLVRAFGQADREFAVANTPATKFRIGSLTKQFTAAALLLLVQDGKLSLDQGLCEVLSPCPEAWRPIRIRQLLNHSSGIPDFVRLPGMRDRFTQPTTLDATIALLVDKPLDFAPGSDARYGNSGLIIAAKIIEKLSGEPYASFLDQRIYRPLGMVDSGYAADGPIIPHRARGYVRHGGVFENAPYIDMSVPLGAGSQYSTVLDLYRWDRALRGDALLGPAMRQAMFAEGLGGYGLGWEVAHEHGRLVTEHNGDINGFGAFIARYPDDDAVIVILTNVEGTKVRAMKDLLAARVFGDRLP